MFPIAGEDGRHRCGRRPTRNSVASSGLLRRQGEGWAYDVDLLSGGALLPTHNVQLLIQRTESISLPSGSM
jgi:hypothetical protein